MKKRLLDTEQASAPTDEEIVRAIKKGGPTLNQVMRCLYKKSGIKTRVVQYVLSNSGNEQDAEDVYQEGICALILNIRADKYKGNASIKHYLYKICMNTWLKRLHKVKLARKYVSNASKPLIVDYDTPEKKLSRANRLVQIEEMMGRCDPNAKKVLSLWRLSYSFQEIADELQLKNAATARKIKFNALKKLSILVNDYPDLMDYYRH